jgi:hypothetical protein
VASYSELVPHQTTEIFASPTSFLVALDGFLYDKRKASIIRCAAFVGIGDHNFEEDPLGHQIPEDFQKGRISPGFCEGKNLLDAFWVRFLSGIIPS